MSATQPFEAIPATSLPDTYPTTPGSFMAAMRQQVGDVFRTTYLGQRLIYVVGSEANRFVLSSARDDFSWHGGWGELYGVQTVYGDGLITMDGPEHDWHRHLMHPAFTMAAVERYLPTMRRIIAARIADWGSRGVINLYDEAVKITFDVIMEALLGAQPGSLVEEWRAYYRRTMAQGLGARSSEHRNQSHEYVRTLMRQRERQPNGQRAAMLLDLLRGARDLNGKPLTEERIIAHINIMLIAGHDTTASLSAWLLYLLARHPTYTARIVKKEIAPLDSAHELTLGDFKRMPLLERAIQEVERLYPPIATGPRRVARDTAFGGYQLPAGSYLFYGIAGVHYAPTVFAEPDRFDPERFAAPRAEHQRTPYALIPFGAGPRSCIGVNIARTEVKALATEVLRRYRLEPASDQAPIQFYRATGTPLDGIPVRVYPRGDSARGVGAPRESDTAMVSSKQETR